MVSSTIPQFPHHTTTHHTSKANLTTTNDRFHPWLRGRVQAALTAAWTTKTPLQNMSPARMVSSLLSTSLGATLSSYVFIDFCAGGGGPTPSIERHINAQLAAANSATSSQQGAHEPAQFVLTDLHPHIPLWTLAAARSPNLTYEPRPVDASAADPSLIAKYRGTINIHALNPNSPSTPPPKKIFRLFNLAFHHFDDPLARAILRNTVETSDAFAVFELQDRSPAAFLSCLLLGLGVFAMAPVYAWKWRSPMTLFWTYVVPVLPFVLVFDGWVSSLRTRTPDEVETLLRTCGAEGGTGDWVMESGRELHLWPCGYLNWIICTKRESL